MKEPNRRLVSLVLAVGTPMLIAGAIIAQPDKPAPSPAPHGAQPDHIMLTPAAMKWTDAPSSLPPGAKMAVLEGDPKSAGPFTMRLKVPAGYKIPAHFHPGIEHVTVISGKFHMGLGDRLDTTKGEELPAGGFAVMAIGTHHFAWADEESIVQIHGMGPWGITYIDPATDPSRAAPGKK